MAVTNRNPPQRSPVQIVTPVRDDTFHKRGPGTFYSQASSAGPNREKPEVNSQSQSATSRAAHGPQQVRAEQVNSRQIDRDALVAQQTPASNYGRIQ
jgi:hypothetical protein